MRPPVCLFALATACTPTDRGEGDEPLPSCETDVAGALAGLRVPGVSAGIIENGEVVCTSVAGMADIEADRPVKQDTVFAWASVSKTMTATAALVLYDEGRFGLDDDIDGHLPFSTRNPNCADDPITFRQLLTHTSSIIDNDEIYETSYTIGDSPIPLGEFVRGYVEPGGASYDAGDNFARKCPGNVNSYSNVAVGLLGHLVEQISGMAFDDFCHERIFVPLGMADTSFHLSKLDPETVAMPYEGRAPDPWAGTMARIRARRRQCSSSPTTAAARSSSSTATGTTPTATSRRSTRCSRP